MFDDNRGGLSLKIEVAQIMALYGAKKPAPPADAEPKTHVPFFDECDAFVAMAASRRRKLPVMMAFTAPLYYKNSWNPQMREAYFIAVLNPSALPRKQQIADTRKKAQRQYGMAIISYIPQENGLKDVTVWSTRANLAHFTEQLLIMTRPVIRQHLANIDVSGATLTRIGVLPSKKTGALDMLTLNKTAAMRGKSGTTHMQDMMKEFFIKLARQKRRAAEARRRAAQKAAITPPTIA